MAAVDGVGAKRVAPEVDVLRLLLPCQVRVLPVLIVFVAVGGALVNCELLRKLL